MVYGVLLQLKFMIFFSDSRCGSYVSTVWKSGTPTSPVWEIPTWVWCCSLCYSTAGACCRCIYELKFTLSTSTLRIIAHQISLFWHWPISVIKEKSKTKFKHGKDNTVEPVLKDHPIGHTNVVSQDRWSLVTGSITLKWRTSSQVVFQDRWSLMAMVSQDMFHCMMIRELKFVSRLNFFWKLVAGYLCPY